VLIRNGVDVAHFRKRQRRPEDLPASPAAVYLGSLHESRLDVALVVELAVGLPELSVVLVGPNHLTAASSRRLGAAPNVTLLGPRPYSLVPAYLQHADVIVIPHVITPFTESLDPIKAYECIAVETPCVATPVAGFRELRDEIIVAERKNFVDAVCSALLQPPTAHAVSPRGWDDAAREFEEVVVAVMSA
jgi:glycosyltransferase involved in cell wall biosynthesis